MKKFLLIGVVALVSILAGCQSGPSDSEIKDTSKEIQNKGPKDAIDTVGGGDAMARPGAGGNTMIRKGSTK